MTATAGSSQVSVSWTDPTSTGSTSISAYKILRATSQGQETLLTTVTGATAHSYNDTAVTPGTTYYYEVDAVNAAGSSAASNEANAVPYTFAAAPSSLTASAGSSEVSLSWSDPTSTGFTSITGYEILRSTSQGQETLLTTVSGANAITYNDTAVTPGTTYYYEVEAVNAAGSSATSNEANALPYTSAAAPTGLTATGGLESVSLAWIAPASNGSSPIEGYEILRSTTSGAETELAFVAGAGTNSYVDGGLTPGTIYYYKVLAVNAAGQSAKSNEASAAPYTVPGKPSDVSATPGNASASVVFTAPSSGGSTITAYTVTATDTTTPPNGGQIANGGSSPIVVRNLVNGDSYTFTVYATNAAGNGQTSASSSAITPGPKTLDVTVSGTQTYGTGTEFLTMGMVPSGVSTTGELSCTTVDAATTINSSLGAGSYTINPADCSGLSATGYAIDYHGATKGFVVLPVPLVITASSAILAYGESPPSVTASYDGFVNGDGPASLRTAPTCTTNASLTSPPGSYPTTCDGAVDANYSIVYVAGSVTVTAAAVVVTPSGTEQYGSSPPLFTITIKGSQSAVTGTVACADVLVGGVSTAINSGLAVGTYDIDTSSCTGLSVTSQDYALTYAPTGDLFKVGQAPLKIRASSATMDYGASVPSITPGYSVFVNGDTPSSLTVAPTCSTTATSTSAVKTYPSSCSGAVDANYKISYMSGTVTVVPTAPSAPSELVAVGSNRMVVLTWKAPTFLGGAAISGYKVFEGTHPGGEGTTPAATTTGATTRTISGLTNGTTYYFTVQAVNTAGGSASSNEASAEAAAKPGAPSRVKAILDKKATPGVGEVAISWTAPAPNGLPVKQYTIVPSPACPKCAGLEAQSAASLVSGLTVGTNYRFTVEASNAAGTGPTSLPSSTVDVTTVPGAPTAVNAKLLPSGDVVVSFAPSKIAAGLSTTSYIVTPRPACPRCKGLTTTGTARATTISGLSHGVTYTFTVQAVDADGAGPASIATSPVTDALATGYYLAAADGDVFGLGMARSLGGITASTADPLVGVAATADGAGYLIVTRDGAVKAFGDAHGYGDLNGLGYTDIVSIVTTTDGAGYWLLGSNGGVYPFGGAVYHGDLPGVGVHVNNIVGMVASPGGGGYQLIGNDGGVFAFGTTHFYGSLPGVHVHVHNIVGILPSATNTGYVLVGSDGGAFVFGTGTPFLGSLPGRHIHVNDIIGLALTADGQGYYMAGADGNVYAFGDAVLFPSPPALRRNLPIVAIANI